MSIEVRKVSALGLKGCQSDLVFPEDFAAIYLKDGSVEVGVIDTIRSDYVLLVIKDKIRGGLIDKKIPLNNINTYRIIERGRLIK